MKRWEYLKYINEDYNRNRANMPQIDHGDIPYVIAHFLDKGVLISLQQKPLSSIKMVQDNIDGAKLQSKIKEKEHTYKTRLFILSSDGFLMDGNHDFAYAVEMKKSDFNINTMVISLPCKELLKILNLLKVSYKKDDKDQVVKTFNDIDFIYKSMTFTDYPQEATNNAKKVLKWIEEKGRDEVQGMTKVGLARAKQIANRSPLTLKIVKDIAKFARHEKNSGVSEENKGKPWKDNGRVAWLGWGGSPMINWAKKELKKIGENKD